MPKLRLTPSARAALTLLLALVALSTAAAPAPARPSLRKIDEQGSLVLHGSRGSSIDERGRGSGTFNCSVSIELTLSGTHVSGEYTAYPQGGSIRGSAHATIHSATGSVAHFSGTIELQGGAGSYAGSTGTASFDGTINRNSYAMEVYIRGMVRL